MTAPADKPAPTSHGATALARRAAGLDMMPPELREMIETRRAMQTAAAEIAKLTWGKSLEQSTNRAIVAWGREYGVDVLTEIELLGGRLYKNAGYYYRRLGEMVDEGLVEYAYADYVNSDARLGQLGEEGKKENERRLKERIKHGIPDSATGAVVFHVKLRAMEQEITGKNWCGGGSRKSDPVGDAEPVKTAETRAARRAVRLICARSKAVSDRERASDAAFEGVALQVAADRARLKAQPRTPEAPFLTKQGDPYAEPPAALGRTAEDEQLDQELAGE